MKNICILLSGSGTNLQNIAECISNGEIENAEINLVIADRDCFGLERAQNLGLKSVLIKKGKNFTENLVNEIPENIDLIVLAGFLSILNKEFFTQISIPIINIHPSLLPKFGGKGMWGNHVHEAVITENATESGATVHYVTEEVDAGNIILQKSVQISEGETAETLAEKIHKIEYEIFPQAINLILKKLQNT
ncbi:phosphoribosylglycinamide formyltransferase [Halpernia frigidisoli]|uniref:Phosphoribosylglycinamide formyltransferase n=1 Tax=Halpernia frigidisoli TaxID=1125876 RepID=A0A1I3DS78_9FLAO|nr:phosphoribosylglycinamide formyltransferase [Halpernia frigidisoli]SFH89409.1 phosphoribosylglycinamide formyltransferase-1 [Halpernia frigidisoli]